MAPSLSVSPPSAVDVFEEHRRLVWGIAYRMLGSCADADDIVQDTYLRWQTADPDEVTSPRAWLITASTRLAIDRLRSVRRRREEYVGPWLPEPILTPPEPSAQELAELNQSLSMAFLVLLERLGPTERAVFLLHEVFDVGHAQIADIVGKSPIACRQIATRARKRLTQGREPLVPRDKKMGLRDRQTVSRFLDALRAADVDALLALLTADAQVTSDGGGRVVAARRVVRGASRSARFLAGLARKWAASASLQLIPHQVNYGPGFVLRAGETVVAVVSLALDADGRVESVFAVRNPEKLRSVGLVGPALRKLD